MSDINNPERACSEISRSCFVFTFLILTLFNFAIAICKYIELLSLGNIKYTIAYTLPTHKQKTLRSPTRRSLHFYTVRLLQRDILLYTA